MSKASGNGNQIAQPRPTAPRPEVAGALDSTEATIIKHAKELMPEILRFRQGYTAEAIAKEAFSLARAFAAESMAVEGLNHPPLPSRKPTSPE
jgi:hypothetical protein